jgi:DNA-binding CsgD family transcriptional regulator
VTERDTPTPVVGRADELAEVSRLVRDAVEGRFGAMVIEGVAGIGKTTLARAACETAGGDVLVLPGACLPLASTPVPLVGLRTAVRALPQEQRPSFLPGAERLDARSVPVAVDEWLESRMTEHPVLLVVDDLHWSDPATLDVLMYLLAGPADRRLGVLVTLRSGEFGTADPVGQWLAAAVRLPGVRQMRVGPLTHDAIADLATGLLGVPVHTSLVDELHERSGGNPYLAALLLRGVPPSARRLPVGLPEQLRSAVERTALSLGPGTRRLCLGLAVSGRPAGAEELGRIAELAAVDDVGAAVREGVAARVLEVDAGESLWFTHPLHAEVLQQSLLPDESRVLHAGFAAELEARYAREPSAEVAEAVATHHDLAGNPAGALQWLLEAAHSAERAGDQSSRLRVLRRALGQDDERPPAEERERLLDEVRELAYGVGDWTAELEAVEALVGHLDVDGGVGPGEDGRLRLAALLVRRDHLFPNLTRGVFDGDTARAVSLTEGSEGSDVRRLAVATHADNLMMSGETELARPLVEEALGGAGPPHLDEVDDAQGSEELRSWAAALYAAAMLAEEDEEVERSRDLAERASDLALAAGDLSVFVPAAVHAAYMECPNFASPFVDRVEAQIRGLESAGGPPDYLAYLSHVAAGTLYLTGRPQECVARLRVVLGSNHASAAEVSARQIAAMLAASQGRGAEADAHLERATELMPRLATHPTVTWCWCRATVSVLGGDAEGAIRGAEAGRSSRIPRATGCEWLIPIAARGLADLAEEARDRGADPGPVLRRLDDLVARDPEVIADVTPRGRVYGPVLDGLQALYEAECARARADVDRASAWTTAVRLLGRTELAWDEAYARWRTGEALLAHGGGEERRAAAEHLREGHTLATRLGAQPVLDAIEALARSARIGLGGTPQVGGVLLDGSVHLTPREREVLAHVVAGRTYAEIADALFLSEKTVSSHISNILRKTGTANRVELASWAARTEQRS